MLVAALLVIPVMAVEESSLGEPWDTFAAVANWGVWLAFLVELVVMLSIVPSRLDWLRRHPLEVAIVALSPPFAPALLQGLRGARLLRLVRLLPVVLSASIARRVFSLEGFRYAAVLATLAVVGGGAGFAAIENGAPDQSEAVSAWDGLWWAISTATTVGYGDITPTTDTGRLIAVALMFIGIGFVGFFTAAIAQRFIVPAVEADIEKAVAQQGSDDEALAGQLAALRSQIAEIEATLQRRRDDRPGGL